MENIELVNNNEEGRSEQFPVGMRVLAVDDNPTCLRKLEELLLRCKYHVTKTMESKKALELLRDRSNMFDLVISDVEMPDADGFKLLEIGLEMDLPVIMLSSHGDYDNVMKGIIHGACDYLVKPVSLKELKNIWQHVVKKNLAKNIDSSLKPLARSESHHAPSVSSRKRKEKVNDSGDEDDSVKGDEDGDASDEDGDESRAPKKPRVVWTQTLHQKFVTAVSQLGLDKAVPKKILDYMNVETLTRENVASHLQKYRLYLKKLAEQQNNMGQNAFGTRDSSYYQMAQLEGLTSTRQYPSSSSLLSRTHLPKHNPSMHSPLNLQGMNSSTFIPHQNPSSSANPFGAYHRSLIPGVQNAIPFQRTSSSLDPLQFPRSKCSPFLGDFKSLRESALGGGSFLDSRVPFGTTSTALPTSNPLMFQADYRQPLDRNQSCLEGSSSMHGLSRFPSHNNWQGSTSFPSNTLPVFNQDQGTYAGNGLEDCTPLVSTGEMQCGTQLLGDFMQNMNTTLDGQKWEEPNCTMMNNNTFGNVDYPLEPADNMVFRDNDEIRSKGLDEQLISPIDDSATLNNQDYVVRPSMLDPEMNTEKPESSHQNDVFADIMNEMLQQEENTGMVSVAARFGLDSFPPH